MDLPESRPFGSNQGAVRYLQAFRRHWPIMVILVGLTVLSTAAITLTEAKKYTATADVQITPLSENDTNFQGFSAFRQPLDGSSAVVTAARVMDAPAARQAAAHALGAAGRGTSIDVAPLSQADIVAVTATAPKAAQAAVVANAFARTFVSQRTRLFHTQLQSRIHDLEAQAAAIPQAQRAGNFVYSTLQGNIATLKGYLSSPDPTVSVLTPASVPTGASSPRPKRSIAVALLASLLLACGIAVLLEFVDPRLRSEEELRLIQRLPVLARVPRLPGRVAHGYLTGEAVLPGEAWKAYRTLSAVLATAGSDGEYPRSILVTSASPSDGKTMTAVNLAITLAASKLRVILVDGDFHRPMLGSIFNVASTRDAFAHLLTGRETLDSILVPAPHQPRLELLPANRGRLYSLQQYGSDALPEAIAKLSSRADVVIIDSPPLPEVAEALSLAASVEAVLISVRLGHTRREKLERLRELLDSRGLAPLGFVVTTRQRPEASYSQYYYPAEPPNMRMTEGEDAAARILRSTDR